MASKYTHDDHYFDNCDTDQKAYWIGFLMADGNVRHNTARMSLVVEGEQTLSRFKRDVATSAPVTNPVDGLFSIHVTSAAMCAGLARYGIVPTKTFKVRWPDAVPREHELAFLLGLFDGDGSISTKMTRYRDKVYATPSLGICGGSKTFLQSVVHRLSEYAGVGRNKVILRKVRGVPTRTYAFTYQGAAALRIRDVLYSCNAECFAGKKEKFFSYAYPSARPHDARQQQEKWAETVRARGGELLGQYQGHSSPMLVDCGNGHQWSPTPRCLDNGTWCPDCNIDAMSVRLRGLAYGKLRSRLEERGWKLLSTLQDYDCGTGDVRFLCAHNVPHTRNCRSAQQSHARCDCESENTLAHGRDRLCLLLKQLGWKLTSDYKGFFKEVRLECVHGKPFSRIAGNIKSKSKCECAGSSSTGAKYIYVQKTGFLVAVSLHGAATRVGIFKKLADAKQARDKFLRSHGAMSRLQKGRGGHRD